MRKIPCKGVVYHFFLDDLADYVRQYYNVTYNTKHQDFILTSKTEKLNNVFLIIRTSKRCYRVAHYRKKGEVYQYFSCSNYRHLAFKINMIVWRYMFYDVANKPP